MLRPFKILFNFYKHVYIISSVHQYSTLYLKLSPTWNNIFNLSVRHKYKLNSIYFFSPIYSFYMSSNMYMDKCGSGCRYYFKNLVLTKSFTFLSIYFQFNTKYLKDFQSKQQCQIQERFKKR